MSCKDYHPLVTEITDFLKLKSIDFKMMEHIETITSEDAAKVRDGYSLQEGVKALIVKCKNRTADEYKFIQLCIPGDKKFSSSKVRALLGVKEVRFANEEELKIITKDVKPGGVPPVGNIFFDLPLYVDEKVLQNSRIVFNCGDRCVSMALSSKDYMKVFNPTVVDVSD